MLQTLYDIKDEEIDKLVKSTIDEIEKIGNDFQITMKLLGATENNKNKSYFQQALMIYPELIRDQYCRDIIKQTKKSYVKQAKAGRLKVNGHYHFVSPDLYAFCEWLFLNEQNPKGLLKINEVYCNSFKNNDELACLRSPHLYKEWVIKKNKINDELNKWFGNTNCIYTSCHNLASKVLQLDFDGDRLLVIKDKALTSIAKRNMQNIVPLYYEMKKAKAQFINNESLYKGMELAFTCGNIGPISNLITIVHNNSEENRKEAENVVKWLTMENNFVIDGAKTEYFLTRPKEINEIIKKHTKYKLPHFFIYAKDKLETQVEEPNNSTMNRISLKIPSSRIKFNKSVGKVDYRVLMNQSIDYNISEQNTIIRLYDYYNKHKQSFNLENKNIKDKDLYFYQQVRKNIVKQTGKDIDYIVNTLVSFLYTVRPTSSKKILWESFGDIIYNNIKNNIDDTTKICPICGKRFKPNSHAPHTICCSKNCSVELKKMNRQKNVPQLLS